LLSLLRVCIFVLVFGVSVSDAVSLTHLLKDGSKYHSSLVFVEGVSIASPRLVSNTFYLVTVSDGRRSCIVACSYDMRPLIETIFPDLKGKTKRILNLQLLWLESESNPALPPELKSGVFRIVHLHMPAENGMSYIWPEKYSGQTRVQTSNGIVPYDGRKIITVRDRHVLLDRA